MTRPGYGPHVRNRCLTWVLLASAPCGCVDVERSFADAEGPSPEGPSPESREDEPPPPQRGVWWWPGTGTDHGTVAVVGDPEREDAELLALADWGIQRIYGDFGSRVADEPEAIAAWNGRLHEEGVSTTLLIGQRRWALPEYRAELLDVVQERLLDFNEDAGPDGSFDGVHLDIEPHALDEWAVGPARRRELLRGLLDAVEAVSEAVPDGLVEVDLPVWLDRLPEEGGVVGWDNQEDLDGWFGRLGQVTDSVSLMAYERPAVETILGSTGYERAALEARVGLEAESGPGATWTDQEHLLETARWLEAELGPTVLDLHSWGHLRAAGTD
jgi:hypothetical protein